MKYGIPFDVAFSISNDVRVAWLVIFGEMDGGEFDWRSGTWRERRS